MMENKRHILMILGVLVGIFLLAFEVRAQSDEGFIYGKVYTIDGDSYQGQIRWGGEETYWTDMFNASKTRNNNLRYLSLEDQKEINKKDDEGWLGLDWKLFSIWEDKYSSTKHQFVCQFGEIKTLTIVGRSRAELEFKNGVKIEVDGEGYNDLSPEVEIYDYEIGIIELKWARIEKIEFMKTPKKLQASFGRPLYGKVVTRRKGEFTGTIWWDHDESLSTDKLDGDNRDGDISIEFGNIKSITKEGNGSTVILNSGREFYLTNSNDVNNENRGIEIGIEGLGKVDIPWREFESITFDHTGKSGVPYDDFSRPTGIKGTVKVIDQTDLRGLIVYDIDEAWEFEMLDGNDDEIEFMIPFRNIAKITPKNYNYSMVQLKNGKSYLLGDKRDVNEHNDGLLVFTEGSEEPTYVPWKRIDEIIFD